MKNCPNCNKELRDEAKFCSNCGHRCAVENNVLSCSKCGNTLRPGAKFCSNCSAKVQEPKVVTESHVNTSVSSENTQNIRVTSSFIHWNILQGQLAVKIDENDIISYGKDIKGIEIQEGVKALLFINGKLIGELGSGRYKFKNWQNDVDISREDKRGVIRRAWDNIRAFLVGLWDKEKAEEILRFPLDVSFSFVLIRASEFPLIYRFSDIPTSTVSCNIGLHLLCKISNINDFYVNHLLDNKFVGFEKIAERLDQAIKTQMNYMFTDINPEQVSNTPEISDFLIQKLRPVISEIYPYIQLNRILNVSAKNEDLDNFRRMAEELYVSERELVELTKRNDFLNRFRSATNDQEIVELKMEYAHGNTVTDITYEQEEHSALKDSQHAVSMQSIDNSRQMAEYRMATTQDVEISKVESQYAAAKEKIYEEMALTEDERAKFDLMLSAQKKLREAKSEEEIAVAVQEFRKSGLLREQEIEILQHQIAHNAQLRDLNDAQVLSMAAMQNQMALDKQQLDWEIQIGNKRIQNQIDRQRMEDAYKDERRDSEYSFIDRRRQAEADYEDSRRRADIELDRQEQEGQLDLLQKAQAIRQQREDAEHRREMEAAEAARRHELEIQRFAHEAEQAKINAYAGMTFEQIMAANPDLTSQGAQALAKKFEAEAAVASAQAAMAQNDKTAQMAIDQRDQMMAFMQQQMAMMRDLSMAGINAGAGHQQAMLDEKQAELNRTRSDASANSDRFVDGMKTTIQAVSNMNRPAACQPQAVQPPQMFQTPVPPSGPAAKQMVKCPSCNAENVAGEGFCSECGGAL